jgi:hypothetical protein
MIVAMREVLEQLLSSDDPVASAGLTSLGERQQDRRENFLSFVRGVVDEIAGDDPNALDSTLTSRINAARRAVGDNGAEQRLIRTITRRGFRFVGNVRAQAAEAMPSLAGQAARGRGESRLLALLDRPAIAVLPFKNMSDDPEQRRDLSAQTEKATPTVRLAKSVGHRVTAPKDSALVSATTAADPSDP